MRANPGGAIPTRSQAEPVHRRTRLVAFWEAPASAGGLPRRRLAFGGVGVDRPGEVFGAAGVFHVRHDFADELAGGIDLTGRVGTLKA
jgi:hypothetical protein